MGIGPTEAVAKLMEMGIAKDDAQEIATGIYNKGAEDKASEFREILASMVINEVIDCEAYEHILILSRLGEDKEEEHER